MMTFDHIIKRIAFHKEEIKKLRELIKATPEAKTKQKQYYKEWEEKNPLIRKIYREKNIDHLKEKAKEWREKNKDSIRKRMKIWELANIDRRRKQSREWYLNNKEMKNKKCRERYRLKKEKELNDKS